jgi:hypothetical protein
VQQPIIANRRIAEIEFDDRRWKAGDFDRFFRVDVLVHFDWLVADRGAGCFQQTERNEVKC